MQMYQIYVAFASTVSEEYFDVVYKKATDYAHCFLYIDKKKNPNLYLFFMQILMLFPLFLDVNFGHDHVDLKSNSSPLETYKQVNHAKNVFIQIAEILLPAFSSKVELEELNLINARPDSL